MTHRKLPVLAPWAPFVLLALLLLVIVWLS